MYLTYFGESKQKLLVDFEVDLTKAHAIALHALYFGPKFDKRGREISPE